MIFSNEQLGVMQELANFINLKNIKINNSKDMDKAFSLYLQSNATNYYLKSDDFDKTQFLKQIKLN